MIVFCLLLAQVLEQRGFVETRATLFPQTAPNDSGQMVGEVLLRYEAVWRPKPWLKLTGGIDGRFDSHAQVDRSPALDVEDRSALRPALSMRRLSAIVHKSNLTVEAGRQFVRWGKTDLLTPTDRFAPKDFLSISDSDFLSVPAVRATYDNGSDSLDLVWQARFTPSRTPLLSERWTVLPVEAAGVGILDNGARYPGGASEGIRWNHNGKGYEFSLTFFNGFNHLPLFNAALANLVSQPAVSVTRYYPRLRQYGLSVAIPFRWFTVKAEGAYYASSNPQMDRFALYVLQLERSRGEWTFVGGYAGEAVTHSSGNVLLFSPDRGLARAFLGRASYNLDAQTTISLDAAIRQTGEGSLIRFEYTRSMGQHWRATSGISWLRGETSDFLGQYRRNSSGYGALRYSF
jgi:hypothetical protein